MSETIVKSSSARRSQRDVKRLAASAPPRPAGIDDYTPWPMHRLRWCLSFARLPAERNRAG